MMKTNCIALAGCITILLAGCGNSVTSESAAQEPVLSESNEKDSEAMPAIVFLHRVSNPGENAAQDTVTFYDRDGKYFHITDSLKIHLPVNTLIAEYEAGEMRDSIEMISACDVEELKSNYQKLCQLSENSDFELKEFEEVPAVESPVYTWYGIYFQGNETRELLIQKKDGAGEHEPNDKHATEIYEWILSSFKKE